MKKNHFFIPYFGNKREEVDKIYNEINFKNIDTIIEPFCGTSAISYYISTQNPKKFKYILNDNNIQLIELYNILKNEVMTNKLIQDLETLHSKIKCKEDYDKYKPAENIVNYVYKNLVYNIRPNLYPKDKPVSEDRFKNLFKAPIIDFLRTENIEITNMDAIELIEKYKDKKNCFIFLDPPYLLTENRFYKNPELNIYEYLSYNDIKKMKSKILLCVNDNWILKLIFSKYKIITYDKIYQTTKKKLQHIIIKNFK